jgi:hypothetical protein
MRAGKVWELISVPVVNDDNTLEWIKISELGKLILVDSKLQYHDGRFIGSNENLDRWLDKNSKDRLSTFFKNLVVLLSTVVANNKELYFEMRPPNDHNLIPAENYISSAAVLVYDGGISHLLSAHSEFNNVNESHPLVQLALSTQSQENKSPLEEFVTSAVYCLSDIKLFQAEKDYGRLRWERNVGFLYEDVDWDGIDQKLKPPYLVRRIDGKIIEITEGDFESWAKLKLERNK